MHFPTQRAIFVVADNRTKLNPCGHPHGSPAEAWQCHATAISDLSKPLGDRNVYACERGEMRELNSEEWADLRQHWRLTTPTRIEFAEREPTAVEVNSPEEIF